MSKRLIRVGAVAVSLAWLGCSNSSSTAPKTPPPSPAPAAHDASPAAAPPDSEPPEKPSVSTVRATLTIDPRPGGKRFQGVWLVPDKGARLLIDYRATKIWRPFEGQKVVATGSVYQPRGQAINATHFRLETLEMADSKSTASIVRVGPRTELSGAFSTKTVPAGAKGAGETYEVFTASDGNVYLVANPDASHAGKTMISARRIQRSPFIAHRGGPTLWILNAWTP